MITLTRYNPTTSKSLKVEVLPSITPTNGVFGSSESKDKEIDVKIKYKNYCVEDDIIKQELTFTIPLEDDITRENIYEGEFHDYVDEYLDDIDIDHFARPVVIEGIARAYVGMVDNLVVNGSMLVNVEIDEFDEDVQGMTMDLDQDNYNNLNYECNNNNNFGDQVNNNVRSLLGECGVRWGGVSEAGRCTICLEMVEGGGCGGSGGKVAVLPCEHVFHGDCIVDTVVKGGVGGSHACCPLCRFQLF